MEEQPRVVLLLRFRGRLACSCSKLRVGLPGLLFPSRSIARDCLLRLPRRCLCLRRRGSRRIESVSTGDLSRARSESLASARLKTGHIHTLPLIPIRV